MAKRVMASKSKRTRVEVEFEEDGTLAVQVLRDGLVVERVDLTREVV